MVFPHMSIIGEIGLSAGSEVSRVRVSKVEQVSSLSQPTKDVDSITTVTTGAIRTEARNAKVTRANFEIMADEWLKQHVTKSALPRLPSQPLQPAITKQ